MPKKLTQEEFIQRSREIHGDTYDYSKVNYINIGTKVCIIDKDYGEFWQNPEKHLIGRGSRLRANQLISQSKTKTQENFIKEIKLKHGGLYDYSKSVYTGVKNKIIVIDPDYGEFVIRAGDHLVGKGHPRRAGTISRIGLSWLLSLPDSNDFINPIKEPLIYVNKQCKKVDGYDPKTNTVYQFHGSYWHGWNGREITNSNWYNKTIRKDQEIRDNGFNLIIMWEHDWKPTKENWDKVPIHRELTDIFIEKANLIHNNFYDYSKTKYTGSHVKVCITHPTKGDFWQMPYSHLQGRGKGHATDGKDYQKQFIDKAIKIHRDKYNYSKTKYVSASTKVCIIDNITQEEFWQLPKTHLKYKGNTRYVRKSNKSSRNAT